MLLRLRAFAGVALVACVVACGSDDRGNDSDAGATGCARCFVADPPVAYADAGADTDDAGAIVVLEPPTSLGCEPLRAEMPPLVSVPFPRNVIVLMGDGMGPTHVEAARVVADRTLAFDELEGPVLYRTDSLDAPIVTDSAAAGTALATGRCTRDFYLGVDVYGVPMMTVAEIAHAQDKQVGIVSNSFLIDASPMAFVVHAGSRYCPDTIAAQLFTTALPEVLLGGFVPDAEFAGELGLDERATDAGYVVGFELGALAGAAEDARVLGLFGEGPSSTHWPDWAYGLTPENLRPEGSDEPTLAQMTSFALERLSTGTDGFFLFVENELADTVGHLAGVEPQFATEQLPLVTLELERAVRTAIDWVEANTGFGETLLLVCADHETSGYTFADGDPSRATFTAGGGHTPTPVPLYAKGPGAERIADVRHLTDIFLLMTGQLDRLPVTGTCPPREP